MTDRSDTPNRAKQRPFTDLWAKSLAVCVIGGGIFGAFAILSWAAVMEYRAVGAIPVDLREIVNWAIMLLFATVWGVLFALPVGIPAGTIAAALMWWLRGTHWKPRSSVIWILAGTSGGLILAVGSATLLSWCLPVERPQLLMAASSAGAGCGALLAWLERPKVHPNRT